MDTRVCWVHGNAKERKSFIARIKKQFEGEDIKTYGDDVSYEYFERQVLCNSCFSDKRLIIMTALPIPATSKQTMMNHMKKLLSNLPEEVMFVVDGIDPAEEKAFYKFVTELGGRVEIYASKLDPNDAPEWVVGNFATYNKQISIEDAGMLVKVAGFDPVLGGISADQLNLAIMKLVSYAGKTKQITKDDITATAYLSEEFVFWRIFDAMDNKNLEACIDVMHKMCLEEDSVRSAVEKLFHICLPRFRLLFFLKEAQSGGANRTTLSNEASSLIKLSQSGAGMHIKMYPAIIETGDNKGKQQPAFNANAINTALNGFYNRRPTLELYSRRDLYRIIKCLQESMVEMRYRNTDAGLMLLTDVLFYTICNKSTDQHLDKLRTSYEP